MRRGGEGARLEGSGPPSAAARHGARRAAGRAARDAAPRAAPLAAALAARLDDDHSVVRQRALDVISELPPEALEAHVGALLRRLADAAMATHDPRFPPNATMGVGPTWQYLAEASEWEQRGRRPR